MNRLLSLLEKIPSWLPFATHRSDLMPISSFSRRDVVIYGGLLLTWFGVGFILLLIDNVTVALLYLLFGLAAYSTYIFLVCTKCPYYNTRCYMAGGQCAGRWFRYRHEEYTKLEDLTAPLLWIGVSIYPIVFLTLFHAWTSLAIYLIMMIAWQILHKRNICPKCRNVRCGLNPHFEGRAR